VTTSPASTAPAPKPISATQLKHLKEKIELVKNDLKFRFRIPQPEEPPEVKQARAVIDKWQATSWDDYRNHSKQRANEIDLAAMNIIESLLFPDAEQNPADLLKQLSEWTPPTPALAPAKTRGKK